MNAKADTLRKSEKAFNGYKVIVNTIWQFSS